MKKSKKEIYNNENPLFFLFTCVKDGRQFINKLFDSLLSQTKVNFVHYIYEDGSSDPIEDIVDEYKEKVAKLNNPYVVIYERNSSNIGLNMATKHCIEKCFLPYFIWVDCDNWVEKSFFEKLEGHVLKNKKSIVIRTRLLDGDTNLIYHTREKVKGRKCKKQLKNFLYDHFLYGFFAVDIKKFLEVNPNLFFMDKRDFFNDVQTILIALSSNFNFTFCDDAIGFFSDRDDNESCLFKSKGLDVQEHNYFNLLSSISSPLSSIIHPFYKIRKLNCTMEYNKLSNIQKSFECFYEILKIGKDEHIPKKLLFKNHSFTYWYCLLTCIKFLNLTGIKK